MYPINARQSLSLALCRYKIRYKGGLLMSSNSIIPSKTTVNLVQIVLKAPSLCLKYSLLPQIKNILLLQSKEIRRSEFKST